MLEDLWSRVSGAHRIQAADKMIAESKLLKKELIPYIGPNLTKKEVPNPAKAGIWSVVNFQM